MIVLDTNVVSAAMKMGMNPTIQAWLDRQFAEELYITATSLAELRFGIEIAPLGRRRALLAGALDALTAHIFEDRVLAFDGRAAEAYAKLVGGARLRGRAIDVADGQIAAIAAVHGFSVATRDVAPFVAAGVGVIDPWTA